VGRHRDKGTAAGEGRGKFRGNLGLGVKDTQKPGLKERLQKGSKPRGRGEGENNTSEFISIKYEKGFRKSWSLDIDPVR